MVCIDQPIKYLKIYRHRNCFLNIDGKLGILLLNPRALDDNHHKWMTWDTRMRKARCYLDKNVCLKSWVYFSIRSSNISVLCFSILTYHSISLTGV